MPWERQNPSLKIQEEYHIFLFFLLCRNIQKISLIKNRKGPGSAFTEIKLFNDSTSDQMSSFIKVMYLLLILIATSGIFTGFSQNTREEVLKSLDEVIANRDYFVKRKLEKIKEIRKTHPADMPAPILEDFFEYYLKLCHEFQTFKFDSAFHYADQLISIAHRINNYDLIAIAKIEFANILISAGIFNESLDTLNSIELAGTTDKVKASYFKVLSRGYFDMESFSESQKYALIYRERGMSGYDSAMHYIPKSSWEYHALDAQKKIKLGKNDTAIVILEKIINNYDLSNDELAIQLMSLAFTYGIAGDNNRALKYMANAAMADIRGAKKEAVALLFLSREIYEAGDIIRASKYINIALEDSKFYGSNFRLWQVSNFLPFIKSEHIVTIEKQKKQLLCYAFVVTLLIVIVGISLVIIINQIGKLRCSKKTVEKINNKLVLSNEELLLSNKIKEEYIGYYFEVSSQIIEKLNRLKQLVGRRLRKKQYDELLLEVEDINIHREKSNLYNNFDQAFLNIFPEFVAQVNLLLKNDEQVQLKEGQLLNTELRIFALIRLGIHDSDKLARILDYSVNTIYAYKSKMKNKAKDPNKFEQDIASITRSKNVENPASQKTGD